VRISAPVCKTTLLLHFHSAKARIAPSPPSDARRCRPVEIRDGSILRAPLFATWRATLGPESKVTLWASRGVVLREADLRSRGRPSLAPQGKGVGLFRLGRSLQHNEADEVVGRLQNHGTDL